MAAGSRLLTLAAFCVSAVLTAQSADTPVFRAGVNMVLVDAFVTDSSGNPIKGLTASDFEIREDGRVQSISSFAAVDLPTGVPASPGTSSAALIAPDVQTNDAPEGRLYVMALDDITPINGVRTRTVLRRFIEQNFGPNDVGAFVLVGHGRRADAQEFTSNRTLLLRAIDRISGWPVAPGARPADATEHSKILWMAMRDLMESLARIPLRHKAVLLIAEDVNVDAMTSVDTAASAATETMAGDIAREAMRAALRGGVTIYPIDPTGASIDPQFTGEFETNRDTDAHTAYHDKELIRRSQLHSLATVTGGFAMVENNNYPDGFARIVRENSSHYVLGYASTNAKADGKFRKLQVKVSRPGVQVKTVNGYLAAKDKDRDEKPSPVHAALASPLAVTGLPLKVFAAPFADGGNPGVVVAIHLPGDAIEVTRKGDVYSGQIDMGFIASGAKGPLPEERHVATLSLQPDTYQRARRNGMLLVRELQLAPGAYQLRVGVAQPGGKSGSVLYDLDVPDYDKAPLGLSGVLFTSAQSGAGPVVAGTSAMTELLPGPMTIARRFTRSDRVTAYGEIYEHLPAGRTITLRMALRNRAGSPARPIYDEDFQANHGTGTLNRFSVELPVDAMVPGDYVLHIEADSEANGHATVARDIPITIE